MGQWLADRLNAALNAALAYLLLKVLVLLPLWEAATLSAVIVTVTATYLQKKTPNLGS